MVVGSKDAAFLMSTSSEKTSFWRILSAYLIAVIAVSFAIVGTSRLGPALKHSSILFLCCVILSSGYGGLLPGLFAASLSSLALDYYFIPPIHSLAMNPEEVPGILIFGAAACLFSWLNSRQRWIRQPPQQSGGTESGLLVTAAKLILALVLSLTCCLAALVAILVSAGNRWEYLWLTIGTASCCSAFFLMFLAALDFR
jgi:K+-sensing histidine kinase KdpD